MKNKQKLIEFLKENKKEFVSGEVIAKELNITRAMIWKYIRDLKEDGYIIEAKTKLGYKLMENSEKIDAGTVLNYLKEENCQNLLEYKIEIFDKINSTNTYLKIKASNEDVPEATVVIANEQTAGRGRVGRTFFSPKNSGIYISMLLKPNIKAYEGWKITSMAGVALVKTVEEFCKKQCKIKWVNDIFLNGKKVSGILTEGSLSMENGGFSYVVLGIGINIFKPTNLPKELEDIFGYILEKQENVDKNKFIALFLKNFAKEYKEIDSGTYLKEYKEYSLVIGKTVSIKGDNQKKYKVLDIDDSCNLILSDEKGKIEKLNSGEISIVLKE